MIVIGKFREIYGEGYPPLSSLISAKPIPEKQKVLKYLKSFPTLSASPAIPIDILSGERIPGDFTCWNDGKYGWRSDVVYYFDKYNLELPQEFIDHVLKEEH